MLSPRFFRRFEVGTRDARRRAARRSNTVHPRAEVLEERALLSVDITRMPAGTPKGTVLILDSTVVPATGPDGTYSKEANEAIAQGYAVRDVSGDIWDSLTAAQFASYSALILGDPDCGIPASPYLDAAVANKSVWGPVVNGPSGGNAILIGTDPVYHSFAGIPGATKLINEGIDWVLNQPGKTGFYGDLSCYYANSSPGTPVPVLDVFSPGGFTVHSVDCTDSGHVVATTPAGSPLHDLNDSDLSSWSCSVHEAFQTWDPSFAVLAIDENAGSSYTATDGTKGDPYILARGVGLTVISNIGLTGPSTATVGTPITFTATATTSTPSPGTPVVGTTVTFKVIAGPDTGVTGTGTTNASGNASFAFTPSAAGTDFTIAQFVDSLGHTETSGTVETTITASVSKVDTTTALTSSLNPSTFGQAVTFTATVTPNSGSGTPTGSVQFFDGATLLGAQALDATDAASISVSTLTVGTHTITASYGGDSLDNSSTSSPLTQTVAYATTVLSGPSMAKQSGSTLPVKIEVTDINGNNLSSPSLLVTAVGIAPAGSSTPTMSAQDSGGSNPGGLFRYDPTLQGYIFNLQLVDATGVGLAPGDYTLFYTIGDDPTLHTFSFSVKQKA